MPAHANAGSWPAVGLRVGGGLVVKRHSRAEALKLWDMVTTWLQYPHLYEIQRPKSQADENAIAEVFRPYLEARDWVSINRGEVFEFKKS